MGLIVSRYESGSGQGKALKLDLTSHRANANLDSGASSEATFRNFIRRGAPAIRNAVDAVFEHFGRIDVILNDAGYTLFGVAEERTYEQIIRQCDGLYLGSSRGIYLTKRLTVLEVQKEIVLSTDAEA